MSDASRTIAWDDFRLVKAIADARHLPAAATALGVNHSTVFRRLGQIEAALGVTLFERHRSGCAPTTAGEEMLALASRMEEDVGTFTRKIAGRELAPAGELRVTTNDTLLIGLLTPIFARFREACSDVRLDVVLANTELNLSKRDADVAIRATERPPETLVGRRIARIAWALYGRRADFPEGAGARDPAARVWASPGDHLAALKSALYAQGHVPAERIAYKANTILGLSAAVEHGVGVAHLPCFIGDPNRALMRLGDVVPDFAADLWLLTHPDLRHSPRVRVFLDFVAGEIARQKPLIEGAQPAA